MSDAAKSVPAADDRGLLYGDGLFETLICYRGRPLWRSLHIDRLALGLDRLAIPLPRGQLETALDTALESIPTPAGDWTVLRFTVTRGAGERGYQPSLQCRPAFYANVSTLEHDPLKPQAPLRVASSEISLAVQPRLAGLKHLNRLEQVLAAAEAQRRGVDDVLMTSVEGDLHSGGRANLFLLQGSSLLTAPCDRCGIEGTRRRLILQHLAPALGLECSVERLQWPDLARSDSAFLCNSVMGVRAIVEVDGTPMAQTQLLAALQSQYEQEGRQCIASS